MNGFFLVTEAIEKFLSSNIVKAEVLASYNDSILSALQSYIGSLKLAILINKLLSNGTNSDESETIVNGNKQLKIVRISILDDRGEFLNEYLSTLITSTVLKAINMPADRATEFINAVVIDYNLPPKDSFALGLIYSDDFAWYRIDFLYSPSMNGIYRSLTIYKNSDSLTNTASFFIVDIAAHWQLAPDLLLIQRSKSYLGGIFESNKQSIQEVLHALTMDEAFKLQQFFILIAMNNLASTLGANVTLPQLN